MNELIEALQTIVNEFQALESASNGTINQFYSNIGRTVERFSPNARYVDGIDGADMRFVLTTGETLHIGTTEVVVTQAVSA